MIAKLKGLLDSTGTDHSSIGVQGVGYLVGASSRTLAALGRAGEACTVYTEMLVSQDSILLMWFGSAEDRYWFRLRTSVQGVGGRVALAILSALETAELHRVVAMADKAMIGRANGVGPKLAARIVNELKDKIGAAAIGSALAAGSTAVPVSSHAADAVSALQNLGFRHAEASTAVAADRKSTRLNSSQ